MPFRIAYLVSGEGRLFQSTLNAQRLGLLPIEISRVIAARPCGALERARRAGIPVDLIDWNSHPDRSQFDAKLNEAIAHSGADGLILNFDFLLRGSAVDQYWGKALNTHFSLLPSFPGFRAIEQAKASGTRFGGATIHLVDSGMDTGPIVSQAIVSIAPENDTATLGRALFNAAIPLQLQALAFLAGGRIHVSRDRHALITGAAYDPGVFSPSLEAPFRDLPAEIMHDVLERVA